VEHRLANLIQSTITFMQDHPGWAGPVVFLLAFCESFGFISLVVPATGILLAVGGLVAAARFEFGPIWLAATSGAIVGDWLAYELAHRFKQESSPFGRSRVIRNWSCVASGSLNVGECLPSFAAVSLGRFARLSPLRPASTQCLG
jgi:membrane protein DedA with SNARE-associated domain